jgi:hypothetical protein
LNPYTDFSQGKTLYGSYPKTKPENLTIEVVGWGNKKDLSKKKGSVIWGLET